MRNYFNYFTEIEEHFTRKREKHLLVSPLDWCLIELWKESGIPLHVALRGIDRSFEATARRRKKPPTTLSYCHPAVMEAFEEYAEAQVGASPESAASPSPLSRPEIVAFLERLQEDVAPFQGEVYDRVREGLRALSEEARQSTEVPAEEIDRELNRFGRLIAEYLLAGMDREEAKELKKSARSELKIYRKRLSKEMYAKLEANYLARALRRRFGLPEFTLFQAEA